MTESSAIMTESSTIMTESSTQTDLSQPYLIVPKPSSIIRFDAGYIKTVPALLKIAEAVVCLTGVLCIQTIYAATYNSAGGWYYMVSMTGFWVSLFFLASYTFHVVEKFQKLPWLITEMGYAGVWAGFYFIAASVSATHGKSDPAWGGAAVVGFVAMFIYGYEAFTKYEKRRRGDAPQGCVPQDDSQDLQRVFQVDEAAVDLNTAASEAANQIKNFANSAY